MIAFHAAWKATAGHTLPDSSLARATTYAAAMTLNANIAPERMGCAPAAY
jgi:hypothetical protein